MRASCGRLTQQSAWLRAVDWRRRWACLRGPGWRQRWAWLRGLGWPRRFPIAQFPNLPLALAFGAGQAARHLRGPGHLYALAISYLALGIWAYLELTSGVNWFRRLLGAYYTASTVLHLEGALHPGA
ncbi:MAG: hypothetical protein ACRDQH_05350 [Pseudonocardiaceae bacterium]